ncbi:MAG: FecR family protein [Phocaeicola sp.]|uniref:FecR family protein n=1 Tax=Phocaeicola sp. TaxID=2773926 RepID=UPI003F9EF861
MKQGEHIDKKYEYDVDKELWFSSIAANDMYIYDAEKAFRRFQERISSDRKERSLGRTQWKFGYVAAVMLLLISVSIMSYWYGKRQLEKSFEDIVVEAPLGSKTKLQLPDGSEVWLNAGSRVVYSQGFGVKNRKLKFQGEAFFTVKANKNLPFRVQTSELNVTVLGTKFNFRNYQEDEEVVVDLEEGRVSLDNQLKKMDTQYLIPSEKMTLNKQTGEMKISSSKPLEVKGWINDVLFFDEELLSDIVLELKRIYHVKIKIADAELKNERFYASFNRQNQNIYEVMDMLSITWRLKYKIENDTIIVYK